MKKIIVIEDEAVLRSLIVDELKMSSFEVISAENGQKGWELILQEKPDLILLDLLMPIMNGYEVLQALKENEQTKDIPCMVISNSGQINDLNRAYDLGAQAVLIKAEFNPDQVVQKVKELLQVS